MKTDKGLGLKIHEFLKKQGLENSYLEDVRIAHEVLDVPSSRHQPRFEDDRFDKIESSMSNIVHLIGVDL